VFSKGNDVWMDVPVKLRAVSGPTDVKVSANTKIRLSLQLERTELRDPIFSFGGSSNVDLTEFECSMSASDCKSLKQDIEKNLYKKFMMKYNPEYFDHPAAYRMLEGLVQFVNNFSANQAESSYAIIKHSRSHIFVAFNCLQYELMELLES